jgi:D-amino-acid dehydrogenase
MEIAGLDHQVTTRRVQGIIKSLPRYYPAFAENDFAGLQPWVGLRPVSPDGLPYLGRSSRWSNLIVATGHAMLGLSLAPVTGQVVAALISREPTGFDLRLLDPER